MTLPLHTQTKSSLKEYRILVHKDDCIKFFDSIRNFSPFTGKRINAIDTGYTMQRYDILLSNEELCFLKLQLSTKTSYWDKEEIDNTQNTGMEDCSNDNI